MPATFLVNDRRVASTADAGRESAALGLLVGADENGAGGRPLDREFRSELPPRAQAGGGDDN